MAFKAGFKYFLTTLCRFIPDRTYLKMVFRIKMGKKLDLENPKTFCEKIQWLKLNDRNPEYGKLVDKETVKDIVARKIGAEYIIQTLGAWDTVDEIEWDKLPDRFVLKTTHGGGGDGVVVCRDKKTFDRAGAVRKLKRAMKIDLFCKVREWSYKGINKRIIAERYIEDSNRELVDYKFFCFDGYVDCVMICVDRQIGEPKFYFFDKDWKLLRYNKRGLAAPEGFTVPKPEGLEEMYEVASKLSEGFTFARIDLYDVDGKVYFGEITFYPNSGLDNNLVPESENRWGQLIKLNQ